MYYYPYVNRYLEFYKYSIENLENFWAFQASIIPWFKSWDKVLESNHPFYRWFVGGYLNASYVCLDHHVENNKKDKVAYYWENEVGEKEIISYYELYTRVNSFSKFLKDLGVQKGDVVLIYMPLIVDAIVAMLSVVRLGATHNVVFSGFSKNSIVDRIEDSNAKFIITATHTYRRGKKVDLLSTIKEIDSQSVQKVVVLDREGNFVEDGKFVKWPENLEFAYTEPVPVESTHPLFVLYTSGTTGKPKGIVHSTGGYLVYVACTLRWAFNVGDDSIWWCTADIGWITGHSYVVYAPLALGLTSFIYEGAPDYPDPSKWWSLIEKHRITEFFTSPTAIRMFMKYDLEFIRKHDLNSLRMLGSVGEPINPEVWEWYYKNIGKSKCPIIDTWWQTETGGFMIAPFMGIIPLRPGFASLPLPGILADVVDENGNSLPPNTKGYLVIKAPWPGMMMGILNDDEKYKQTYWSKFDGMYYPGDYAIRGEEGYFQLLGRADEVIKIAGHRLGTTEIESAILENDFVAEAAVVGVPDEVRGETVAAFVTLKQGINKDESLKQLIISKVREIVGPVVVFSSIFFVDKLPKTRSGKIMRRLLKSIIIGKELGDVTTLEEEASVEEIKKAYEEVKQSIS
ncbi:MAG: acetate--CoA ligase [Candidatus Calescibacterium sp.]|nr:acetate--CoA ligase [Candidatus Calescibacterium sp.]MDW8132781.1 acetate--CoA ligase [Candidatus Calescibacterium sp.]